MAHVKIDIMTNVAVGENIVNTVGLHLYSTLKSLLTTGRNVGRKLERRKHSYNFKIIYSAIPRVH
jgi:hypothetical protein